jgi:cyclase
VREEASRCFERGLTPLQASKRIDLGPYESWSNPARLCAHVERAYRDLRGEPADAPWDMTGTFDAIYEVAKARRCEIEF